jgi:hypothetical protein
MHNDNQSQKVAKYREDRRPDTGYLRESKGKFKVLRSKTERKSMHVFLSNYPSIYSSKCIVNDIKRLGYLFTI